MKLKKVWKRAGKGGPLSAIVGAILAGIGWEIGSGIYHGVKRIVTGKREQPRPEEER